VTTMLLALLVRDRLSSCIAVLMISLNLDLASSGAAIEAAVLSSTRLVEHCDWIREVRELSVIEVDTVAVDAVAAFFES
jgi:hypothetical protein